MTPPPHKATSPLGRILDRESADQFRSALFIAPFLSAIYAEDGELIFVSKVCTEWTGYAPGGLPTFWEWTRKIFGQRRELKKPDVDRLFRLNETVDEGEYVLTAPGGETRIWDFSSAPLGQLPDGRRLILTMGVDVTARNEAEQMLQEAHRDLENRVRERTAELAAANAALEQLASFPELNPNPILEAEINGRLTYSNPAARAIFPDLELLQAKHPFLLDLRSVVGALQKTQKATFTREITIGKRVFEQHLSYLPQGDLVRSYVLDITERKEVDQLKDDFVSTVSHELRTPLSISKEGISLLLDQIPGPVNEKQEKILRIGLENINRLARIINSLLDISKIEAGRVELKRERVDLAKVIQHVALSFEVRAMERGLALKIRLPPSGGLEIFADEDKVIQIFTNLVGNALKFTRKGEIEISARNSGGEVECRVSDTGPGIDKENLPKVFDRFRQFGRTAGAGEKGTGLGLAITKGLVELHYGRIRVESEMERGTTFIFTLPTYTIGAVLRACVRDGLKQGTAEEFCISLIFLIFSESDRSPSRFASEGLPKLLLQMEGKLRKEAMVFPVPGGLAVLLPGCRKEEASRIQGRLRAVAQEFLSSQGYSRAVKLESSCATCPDDAPSDEALIARVRQEVGQMR